MCPKLHRSDGSYNPRHGTWYYRLELPPGPGGKRRSPLRVGGFATRDDAEAARDEAKAKLGAGGDPANKDKTGPYLQAWLAGRRKIKQTTRARYETVTRLYLDPLLGHIPLDKLRPEDVAGMFNTIREWNEAFARGEPVRKHQHYVGPATMQRIRAVLRAALNAAGPARVPNNPARGLEMDPEPKQRPRVWTPERTEAFWAKLQDHLAEHPKTDGLKAWRAAWRRPYRVMVWTPEQAGWFLDYTYEQRHPLADMFETILVTGIRRAEACGLPWTEVVLGDKASFDVVSTRVTIGNKVVPDSVKSDASNRTIAMDPGLGAKFRALRKRLPEMRLAAGSAWAESGLVFIQADGSGWHPNHVTMEFARLAHAAGLPPITLHGLRHAMATYALLAGVKPKVVQERMGHTNQAITDDTYTSVLTELDEAAAAAIVATIPRHGSRPDGHPTATQRSSRPPRKAAGNA
jgi:integrase